MSDARRAAPFYMKGGPLGCLLVHGYTDSPFTLATVGKKLAAAGHTVRCDILPGHGTDPAELNRLAWRDWWEAVLHAHDALARECSRVVVVGLSFGGTLALHLAQHRPLAGLVTLAAMLGTVDAKPYYARWLKYVMPFVPKTTGPDVSRPLDDYVGYDTVPVGGVAEVMKLIAHVRADLAQVRCPILVMHGEHDHTVPVANAHTIVESVSSADKRLVVLARSCHVITLDVEHETLENEVLSWVSHIAERARQW